MNFRWLFALTGVASAAFVADAADNEPRFTNVINIAVPHISTDKSVRYDYDIVYVRAPRAGDKVHKRFYTDFSQPVTMEPGADLMLLHPDGREELLAAGGDGSITDPVVSFDAKWVYFVRIHNLKNANQWTPPEPGKSYYEYGVFNMGPCPLPGGRLAFTSNRDGFRPAKGYPAIALQLFVMADRA